MTDASGVGELFCTLFDADYMPRGLALYRSLEEVAADFHLRAYCMEPGLTELLDRLALPHLTAVDVRDVEATDVELAAVRKDRTWAEYCWTATPSICLHSLDAEPTARAITYLDADLMFFEPPDALFAELGEDSVLIVPSRFSSRWQHCLATHGTYNVEFNTFRRDDAGLATLRWWREQCLEWCHLRFEEGRYGDQFYLNEFAARFPRVHVLRHRGGGVAPWNSEGATVERRDGRLLVDSEPLIFYHYATLHLYRGRRATALRLMSSVLGWLGAGLDAYRGVKGPEPFVWRPWPGYRFSQPEIEQIWEPYVARLSSVFAELHAVDPSYDRGFFTPNVKDTGLMALRGALPIWARRLASRLRRRVTTGR